MVGGARAGLRAHRDGGSGLRRCRAGRGQTDHQPATGLRRQGRPNPNIQVPHGPGTVRLCERLTRPCRTYPIGADGTVEIDTTTWTNSPGRYRVELLDWADKYDPATGQGFLQPSFAGPGLSSHLGYVDLRNGKDATLDFGVWNPDDYCQDNPDLATPCQQAATKPGGKTLVTFPYTSRGDTQGNPNNPTVLANGTQTGTAYGVAYDKKTRRIFTGAYAKRHGDYGPGGPGAIYVTDRNTGATTQFAIVPGAGNTPHNQPDRVDADFAAVVGQESLGDIEISADGSRLYVVNMKDRSLYTYDTATATPVGAPLPIPDTACTPAADWRPMGLGMRDGVLYAGGVCSAQSTQNVSQLRAVVWTFNPATGTFGSTPIVDEPLDFPRDPAVAPTPGNWKPWTKDDLTQFPDGGNGQWAYPQPMLSDIEIERDGSLVLGFRDRMGDQSGLIIPNANPAKANVIESIATGGDLYRVCRTTTGTYEWEGGAACPRTGSEFYKGDEWYQGAGHLETVQGALALPLGGDRLAATVMDPVRTITSTGVGFFDRWQGDRGADPSLQGLGLTYANDGGFGKANGLGDLELLCDEPPVQIGNRVWRDKADGTQSYDETAGIPGVTVILRDANGQEIARKKTDAKGEYYFDHRDGLRPNTQYKLEFDKSTADPTVDYEAQDLWWTPNIGLNQATNSDAVPDGANPLADTATVVVTTGPPGTIDHDIDAGLWVAS
ncbi:hypothetical protein HRW18_32505 [Streptomyces lunaelactis]|uniref:SdrD B-like domain-containing protein n=1 Tax=Streptomyces lunaelactis TaxID=1535768 RepID=UPI0015854EA4|nr:SdrD B-like domain-containing protein [Streptomyces lunaelactis]NUK12613.1 hypothetical protein [Streptomyces lunaelactis]NUL25255.1 hypothetical protein [Streptomyces lunaelactis]